MDLKDELDNLQYLLKKKKVTYNEFNELIGSYYVKDYEELEDNYYLIDLLVPGNNSIYTDYIQLIN